MARLGRGRPAKAYVFLGRGPAAPAVHSAGASLTVTPLFTAQPHHQKRPGGWWQYFDVRRYAEQEFQFYAFQAPFACPRCGEPLTNAPPTDAGSSVELFCRFDGWQYPRDRMRPVRL